MCFYLLCFVSPSYDSCSLLKQLGKHKSTGNVRLQKVTVNSLKVGVFFIQLCFGLVLWPFHQLLSISKLKNFTHYNDMFVSIVIFISKPLSFFPLLKTNGFILSNDIKRKVLGIGLQAKQACFLLFIILSTTHLFLCHCVKCHMDCKATNGRSVTTCFRNGFWLTIFSSI